MDQLSKGLIDHYQRGLPLCSRPFQVMAEKLGVTEKEVIESLQKLSDEQVLSRVGPVFDHHKAGGSTLAALAVPEEKLEEVAELVNRFDEVNHNYSREHDYNLWFVVTACCQNQVEKILDEIEQKTGLEVLYLPMEKSYHIDLGFKLDWQVDA